MGIFTGSGKLVDDFPGNGMPFGLSGVVRRTNGPDTFFEAFDGQSIAAKEPVLDRKAAAAPLGYAGIHVDDIAE